MDRSIPELLAILSLAVMGILLLGFLGFGLMFGAADNTQVTFEAEQLSADGVVDDIAYDPPTRYRSLVEHLVRNGSGRQIRLRYEPFFEEAPRHQIHEPNGAQYVYVDHEGTFYRVAVTSISDTATRRQTLELVQVNGTSDEVLGYDALPAVDRNEVRSAYTLKYKRGCGDSTRVKGPGDCWSTYSTTDANRSVLVPTPTADFLRYRNQTFRVVTRERTVDGTAITSEASAVANDAEAFRSEVGTAVDMADLTDGERKPLERAIGDGYHVQVYRHDFKQVPCERFNSLLPKLGLPTFDRLSQGHRGSRFGYIEYRGAHYRVHIEYVDTYA